MNVVRLVKIQRNTLNLIDLILRGSLDLLRRGNWTLGRLVSDMEGGEIFFLCYFACGSSRCLCIMCEGNVWVHHFPDRLCSRLLLLRLLLSRLRGRKGRCTHLVILMVSFGENLFLFLFLIGRYIDWVVYLLVYYSHRLPFKCKISYRSPQAKALIQEI